MFGSAGQPDGGAMALSSSQRPMRVLGIDPRLTRCGRGGVAGTPGRTLTMVEVGVARTPADDEISQRLLALEREFEAWMTTHQPGAVAGVRGFSQRTMQTE